MMAKENRFPQVGEIFQDRYRVERVIGRGGFSRVYLARQVDLDRLVALKVLNPDDEKVPDSTRLDVIVSRFEREARTISKFKDSHTVVMHDYGRTDEDLLFMVLEHVDGMNLRQLVGTEGAIAPKRVVFILRQILSSLQEAHAFGVLHRDIKPQNIMIYEHVGRKDQVKVLDFGIAKTFSDEKSANTKKLTVQGNIVGTPRYMSPEQLRGDIKLGPPSDLYSLGLVGYELLVGEKVAADLSGLHVVERHLSAEPIRLPDSIEVPGGLRKIINSMLAKSVTNRYADCNEVLDALEDWKSDSVPAPAGSVPRKKSDVSDDSTPSLLDSFGETEEVRPPKMETSSTEAQKMHPGASEAGKATVQIPVVDLSELARQSKADTMMDMPSPGDAAASISPPLSLQDSLADTVQDRAAVQLPEPTSEKTSTEESREFEPPNAADEPSRSGGGSKTIAKLVLLIACGVLLAYGGWYASNSLRTAQDGAESASTDAGVDSKNAAKVEPVEDLAMAEANAADAGEDSGGEGSNGRSAEISARTSAISHATSVARFGGQFVEQLPEPGEEKSGEKVEAPGEKERSKSARKQRRKRNPRKTSDATKKEAKSGSSKDSNSNKLKPLDGIN